jgi:hypothetical protein
MAHRTRTRTTALTIGAGVLLAPLLPPVTAAADPDGRGWMEPAEQASDEPVGLTAEPLASGAVGEFSIENEDLGLELRTEDPVDLTVVRAELAPGGTTAMHGHHADGFVIVTSGTLRVLAPEDGDGGHGDAAHGDGCTRRTYHAGDAFEHARTPHRFDAVGAQAVEFYVVYFVPEGGSPAPVPAGSLRGC